MTGKGRRWVGGCNYPTETGTRAGEMAVADLTTLAVPSPPLFFRNVEDLGVWTRKVVDCCGQSSVGHFCLEDRGTERHEEAQAPGSLE